MRALTVDDGAFGPVEVPVGEAGPGRVLVRVAAAAVNPVDVGNRQGVFVPGLVEARARTGLGWDVAGTVEAVGPGVRLEPGTPVIGLNDRLAVSYGTHAGYVVLDAGAVAPAPGIDPARAATLPLNGTTAWQALDLLDLAPGGTLLVTGAGGGIGALAVQLAARRGLTVVAAVRAGATPPVGHTSPVVASVTGASLAGADHTITSPAVAVASPAGNSGAPVVGAHHTVTTGTDWADRVRDLVPGGVDGVLDAAALGGPALDAARGGGRFAWLLPALPAPVALRGMRISVVAVHADAAVLADLATLAAAGELVLPEVERYGLDDAAAAYERAATGGRSTRIVLIP